jgi:hypothetical protein
MASGPEHYREAERLLGVAEEPEVIRLAEAQVHATLALAAATALPAAQRYVGTAGGDDREWAQVTA